MLGNVHEVQFFFYPPNGEVDSAFVQIKMLQLISPITINAFIYLVGVHNITREYILDFTSDQPLSKKIFLARNPFFKKWNSYDKKCIHINFVFKYNLIQLFPNKYHMNDRFCDYDLKINESTSLKVHKHILIEKSNYFRDYFLTGILAGYPEEIIKPIHNVAFKSMIQYFYGDQSAPNLRKMMHKVYFVAKQFDATQLKEFCEQYMLSNISQITVPEYIYILSKFKIPEVGIPAYTFMLEHVELLGTAKWKKWASKYPEVFSKFEHSGVVQIKYINQLIEDSKHQIKIDSLQLKVKNAFLVRHKYVAGTLKKINEVCTGSLVKPLPAQRRREPRFELPKDYERSRSKSF